MHVDVDKEILLGVIEWENREKSPFCICGHKKYDHMGGRTDVKNPGYCVQEFNKPKCSCKRFTLLKHV